MSRISLADLTADLAAVIDGHYGIDHVPDKAWRLETNRLLTELFFKATEILGTTCLIQCGAHEASASARFASQGSSNRAIAIEANPYVSALYLPRFGQASRVKYITAAIGAQAGFASLFLPGRTVNSKFSRKAGLRKRRASASTVALAQDEVETVVTTVDAVVQEFCGAEAELAVWLDVEGATDSALGGMSGIFTESRVAVVFVELEALPFWENGPAAEDIAQLLHQYGMTPIAIDAQGYPGQFNAVFVRGAEVSRACDLAEDYWSAIRSLPKSSAFNELRRRVLSKALAPWTWASRRWRR